MNTDHAETQHGAAAFERFFRVEVIGSVVLLACAITAFVWANTPGSEHCFHILRPITTFFVLRLFA